MSDAPDLRVLVVEDEPVALEAHSAYVDRIDGFAVVATAPTLAAAIQAMREQPVDLVLLDLNLPDGHGLDAVRVMRAAGHRADVVAVTSARDLDVVRAAVSLGVVHYVLKPFVFATLRDRLVAYRDYRDQVRGDEQVASQAEVDRVLSGLRPRDATLPKGMSADVLERATALLREGDGLSAAELGAALGVSRVTARRYAEHLATTGSVTRRSRHTRQGRPEMEYRWAT